MKKILLIILSVFSFIAYAHKPNMEIFDLGNGMIKFYAKYSDDYLVENTEIHIVKNKPYNGLDRKYDGKKILYTVRLDKNGEAILYKPNTKKWFVAFDQEEGHRFEITKVPALKEDEKTEWEKRINEDINLSETDKENLKSK